MREKFAFQKSIGLALWLEGKLPFLLCFTWYLRETSKYKPLEGVGGGGACIWKGYLTESFLRYDFGWLICRGVFTWRGLFSEFYGVSQLI